VSERLSGAELPAVGLNPDTPTLLQDFPSPYVFFFNSSIASAAIWRISYVSCYENTTMSNCKLQNGVS